jgi:TRAP-type C4-dicarboxylate transport system permease small subunit
MFDLWIARFDRAFSAINIALMGVMTVMVTVAVILRYVFSISFAWSEEAVAMVFVMSSLFGSVYVARRGDHIAIDFIYGWVSPAVARWLRVAVSLAVIVTMLVIANASLAWIGVSMTIETPAMRLPFWWFYAVLPVAFVLIAIVEAFKIIMILRASAGEGRS